MPGDPDEPDRPDPGNTGTEGGTKGPQATKLLPETSPSNSPGDQDGKTTPGSASTPPAGGGAATESTDLSPGTVSPPDGPPTGDKPAPAPTAKPPVTPPKSGADAETPPASPAPIPSRSPIPAGSPPLGPSPGGAPAPTRHDPGAGLAPPPRPRQQAFAPESQRAAPGPRGVREGGDLAPRGPIPAGTQADGVGEPPVVRQPRRPSVGPAGGAPTEPRRSGRPRSAKPPIGPAEPAPEVRRRLPIVPENQAPLLQGTTPEARAAPGWTDVPTNIGPVQLGRDVHIDARDNRIAELILAAMRGGRVRWSYPEDGPWIVEIRDADSFWLFVELFSESGGKDHRDRDQAKRTSVAIIVHGPAGTERETLAEHKSKRSVLISEEVAEVARRTGDRSSERKLHVSKLPWWMRVLVDVIELRQEIDEWGEAAIDVVVTPMVSSVAELMSFVGGMAFQFPSNVNKVFGGGDTPKMKEILDSLQEIESEAGREVEDSRRSLSGEYGDRVRGPIPVDPIPLPRRTGEAAYRGTMEVTRNALAAFRDPNAYMMGIVDAVPKDFVQLRRRLDFAWSEIESLIERAKRGDKHALLKLVLFGVVILSIVRKLIKNRRDRKRSGGKAPRERSGGKTDTRYPPNRGFLGVPKKTTLKPGTTIDRVGDAGGTYASPAGTPLEARSLPPSRMGDPIRKYEILKPIEGVLEGPAAPWYGQPGMGTQYKLPDTIANLVKNGSLREVR